MVVMGLAQIVKFMPVPIEAAGGDRMQKGLPQMRAGAFYQRNLSGAAAGIAVAKPGHELEPRRPAADHDNAMRVCRAF
jgi:hypothetical protein